MIPPLLAQYPRCKIPALALAFGTLASSLASAAVTVQQLKLEQGYVILKFSEGDAVTQGAVLDGPTGADPCKLKIYFVKGNWAGAMTQGCPGAAEKLAPGTVVGGGGGSQTPSAAPDAQPEKPAEAKDFPRKKHREQVDRDSEPSGEAKYHHFGIHAYYSLASSIGESFSYSGNANDGRGNISGSTSNTYSSSGAPGLGVRYTLIKRYPKPSPELRIGGMLGFNYDLSRKITQGEGNLIGTQTYADLSVKFSDAELNFVVEYGAFYGFLGPNYSFVSLGGADASQAYSNYGGALGEQIGAGYSFGSLGLEALYRIINGTSSSAIIGIDEQSGSVKLSGLMLRVRYDFDL